MTRYIDADALKERKFQKGDSDYALGWNDAIDAIRMFALPVDAKPIRHGEWVEYPYCLCYEGALTEEDIACSSCGAVFNVIDNCTETFKYCPNCGADMRGEE